MPRVPSSNARDARERCFHAAVVGGEGIRACNNLPLLSPLRFLVDSPGGGPPPYCVCVSVTVCRSPKTLPAVSLCRCPACATPPPFPSLRTLALPARVCVILPSFQSQDAVSDVLSMCRYHKTVVLPSSFVVYPSLFLLSFGSLALARGVCTPLFSFCPAAPRAVGSCTVSAFFRVVHRGPSSPLPAVACFCVHRVMLSSPLRCRHANAVLVGGEGRIGRGGAKRWRPDSPHR